MKKHLVFMSSILLLVFCFGLNALAQETTGEIQGTIKDSQGAVVPNVTVTVKGTNIGITRTAQTDSDGVFHIRQIPSGTYTVSTTAANGFAEQTQKDIQVTLGNATPVNFVLSVTAVSSVVNVTGDAGVIVDTTETKSQNNISARDIDNLPKGTGFSGLLKTAASVRPEPLSGQFSINGSTGPENSFMIDGQETQSYKTGQLNANNDVPYQTLQEIQVKSSGFEAEFGGATGGVINAVTKSGSNQFHGEFGFNLSTQKLNAATRSIYTITRSTSVVPNTSPNSGQGIEVFPAPKDQGTNFDPTAIVSGPIVKDKLWFFAIHSPRIVNIQRQTTYVSGFGPTRTLTAFSPALLAAGATSTQTFREKTTYNYSQFRLDASPFNNLRLSASYTWNPIVDQGGLGSSLYTTPFTAQTSSSNYVIGSPSTLVVNGTTYQGAQAAQFKGGRQNSDNVRLEGVYTPSSKLIFLGRYTRGFDNIRLGAYGIPTAPDLRCTQVPTGSAGDPVDYSVLAGCTQGFATAPNNQINREVSLRTTVDAQVSYLFNLVGHHEIKGGYQFSQIFNDISNGFIGSGRTYLYYGQKCFNSNFTYVQWQIVGTYTCPANSIGTGVNYQFGNSGTATNTANTLFVQDKWQPTTRLTLNIGLRDEQENIPAFNQNSIDLKFHWKDKLAPRIGVAYALTNDGKTKISAFYGRFFDRLKFSLPQGSFGGQFYHVSYFYITADHPNYTYYTVANLKGNYAFPAGGQCPITSGSTSYVCDQDYRIASNIVGASAFTNGQVDPNVKPYRQSEYTVEFQREIMRATVFTARGLYRHLDQTIEDIGVPTSAGEAYIIGNPGQGLAAQVYQQLGYNKIAKAVRTYKAIQTELDTRYIKNLSLNLNYTLSRLYGNYSGLADPDELITSATGAGRTSPNTNRDFDEPWVGFTASGQQALGVLPLDRTHVFKASGVYTFDWWNSKNNSTDLGFFTTAESGTPLTTFVNIMSIPIPETKRGDLGRTPVFTQTDLNLSHRYKFGSDSRYTVAFDLNVINVFNENNVVAYNTNKFSGYFALASSNVNNCGTSKLCATNVLTSTGVLSQYAAAEQSLSVTSTVFGVNAARNVAFMQPYVFQEPRTVRFGLRFLF